MRDRSQNRKAVLTGPVRPAPVSPFYSIYDVWTVSSVQTKIWTYTIPPDGMVYSLCNFCVATNPNGWVIAAISLNGDVVYSQYTGYEIRWSPGAAKGPKLKAGDVLLVGITMTYTYEWVFYWQLDFWRDPV